MTFLTKFSKSSCLLLFICQQTRHKLCGNTRRLQFFGQDRVARALTHAHFFGSFTDSQATISTNHSTQFLSVIVVSWRGRPLRLGIVFDGRSAQFETLVPPVMLRTAQTILPINLLQHLKSLRKIFPPIWNRISRKHVPLQDPSLWNLQNVTASTKIHANSRACSSITNWRGVMRLEAK